MGLFIENDFFFAPSAWFLFSFFFAMIVSTVVELVWGGVTYLLKDEPDGFLDIRIHVTIWVLFSMGSVFSLPPDVLEPYYTMEYVYAALIVFGFWLVIETSLRLYELWST